MSKFLKKILGFAQCPTCKRWMWISQTLCMEDNATGEVYHAFCFYRES